MTTLQRAWSLAGLLAAGVLVASCGGTGSTGGTAHPLTNQLDPSFKTLELKTLAAVPFASDVAPDEDPDSVAPGLCESKFFQALNPTTAFTVIPTTEVMRVLEEQKLVDAQRKFYKGWIQDQSDYDADFIKKVASLLKVDGVVVGAVDVWHQQPVDITETGTARTSVGLLVGVFDGATGKRMWLGRDENFKEALRYTPNAATTSVGQREQRGQMERTNLRVATGVYAPPEFSEVVDIVVGALVQGFPKRVK